MTVEDLEGGLRWLFGEIYTERQLNRRRRHFIDIVKERRRATRLSA